MQRRSARRGGFVATPLPAVEHRAVVEQQKVTCHPVMAVDVSASDEAAVELVDQGGSVDLVISVQRPCVITKVDVPTTRTFVGLHDGMAGARIAAPRRWTTRERPATAALGQRLCPLLRLPARRATPRPRGRDESAVIERGCAGRRSSRASTASTQAATRRHSPCQRARWPRSPAVCRRRRHSSPGASSDAHEMDEACHCSCSRGLRISSRRRTGAVSRGHHAPVEPVTEITRRPRRPSRWSPTSSWLASVEVLTTYDNEPCPRSLRRVEHRRSSPGSPASGRTFPVDHHAERRTERRDDRGGHAAHGTDRFGTRRMRENRRPVAASARSFKPPRGMRRWVLGMTVSQSVHDDET